MASNKNELNIDIAMLEIAQLMNEYNSEFFQTVTKTQNQGISISLFVKISKGKYSDCEFSYPISFENKIGVEFLEESIEVLNNFIKKAQDISKNKEYLNGIKNFITIRNFTEIMLNM